MFMALRHAGEHIRPLAHVDWFLFASALCISLLGLFTMRSFGVENSFFDKQIIWISVAVAAFFVASLGDYSFLRRTPVVIGCLLFIITLLGLVFAFGAIVKGGQNRFDFGFFAVQPAEPAKLMLILLLAKYFSRRHIEIKHYKHVLVSGAYAFLIFALVFLQPDFGSSITIFGIWFGMVLVSGISWKHVAVLLVTAAIIFAALWQYGLRPYQKARILTFIHPLADIHGTGYNAYQSTVAVGSGEIVGKGIGYGTQSKLQFLPEFQTDFIFAAFAEEWGFLGVALLLFLYGILIWRLLFNASIGETNFETLFAVGLSMFFMTHIAVTIGMNMGVLPVTGISLPLMSYGGSHIITESIGLGILMGMRRYARATSRESLSREFLGLS